jgi:formylglycine-generating enzyme required for sulfatase activity
MGTNLPIKNDQGWDNDVERPVHKVTITKDFWIGKYPVTQGQWQDVMGNNPSYNASAGPDAPVEQVSFKDVQTFLAKVNASERRWIVRLPTEAEWEYAARAGTTGETYGPIDEIAWYGANAKRTTHPVGQKQPNAFGLYDMLGNVWQWCEDWFAPYTDAPSTDPQGAASGEKRIMRGGCWYCDTIHIRAARRNRDPEEHSSRSIGFRIAATLSGSAKPHP